MQKGFTMLELVIMILLIVITSGIILTAFSSLNSSQVLQGSAEVVKASIEQAQSLTLSSRGDTQYGVHFDSNQVVLFQGSTYSATDPNNATTTLSSKVTISSTQLTGGGSEVIFDRLTGATSESGTTTLSLVSDNTKQVKIVISATGSVNSQ